MQSNETPQEYYDRTGQLPPALNPQDVLASDKGASTLVDAQYRPYINGVSQGPAYFIKPDGGLIAADDPNRSSIYREMPQENFLKTVGPVLAAAGLGVAGGLAGLGGAAGGGTALGGAGSFAGADALGLAQMGLDAGITNPLTMSEFISSGGTLGSTAAGGGGVGLGAAGAAGAVGGVAADSFLPGAGEAGAGGVGSAAGSAAVGTAASALAKLTSGGDMTADDWAKLGLGVAGVAAPAIGSYLSGNETAGAIKDIYNQQRADRAPALAAYNNALANPDQFYNSAPAMGSVDAILRKLSVQGNPAANPGLLSQAASYNLGGYNNYLNSLAGPAFGGQGTQANLGLAGAQAQGSQYAGLGYGLGQMLNPQPQPQYGLTIGGMKF